MPWKWALLLTGIGLLIFAMCVPVKEPSRHGPTRISVVEGQVKSAAGQVELFRDMRKDDFTLAASNTVAEYRKPHLCDPWGNSLQFVDRGEGEPIGVFSFGEDGRSATNGNDTDDINSWSLKSHRAHYDFVLAKEVRRQSTREFRRSFLVTVLVFFAGVLMTLFFRFSVLGSSNKEESEKERGQMGRDKTLIDTQDRD